MGEMYGASGRVLVEAHAAYSQGLGAALRLCEGLKERSAEFRNVVQVFYCIDFNIKQLACIILELLNVAFQLKLFTHFEES